MKKIIKVVHIMKCTECINCVSDFTLFYFYCKKHNRKISHVIEDDPDVPNWCGLKDLFDDNTDIV